uniref:RanBD1 domain-containing protein n=1 Tax=Elaeophora elaphi TaxID=1147741 RepID=A0A0R3RHZ0_9BILA
MSSSSSSSSSGGDGSNNYITTEQNSLLMNENGQNVSGTRIEKRMIGEWSSRNEDYDTKSQKFISSQKEATGFLRRTFSFQVGKTKELFKLDPETNAMIKLRYKDTSKHIIWPDCALPEEYNRSCLTLNAGRSKRKIIRFNHAGNHQATILRLINDRATGKDLPVVSFGSPRTFPRTKQKQQLFHNVYPSQTLPLTSLAKIREEKQTISVNLRSKSSERIVDIEDDRTPVPKRVINSVRRSESSDENESIVNLTAPRVEDESGFCEDDAVDQDNEPDLQIWRL